MNFRMNNQKTKISDSLVLDSIKSDKRFYIFNTPIFNKKGSDFDSFEKHLLYILMFARQFPDSGQLKTLLSDLDRRMEEHLKPYDEKVMVVYPNGDGKFHEKIARGDNKFICGICTDNRQCALTHSEAKDIGGASELGEQQYSYQNLYVTGLIKEYGVLVSNIEDAITAIKEYLNEREIKNKTFSPGGGHFHNGLYIEGEEGPELICEFGAKKHE